MVDLLADSLDMPAEGPFATAPENDDGDPGHFADAPDEGKPVILLSNDEERITTDAIAILARTRGDLFQRAGELVHVVEDASAPGSVRAEEPPRITRLQGPRIREMCATEIAWRRMNREGEYVEKPVPQFVVPAIMCRGTWPGVRPLEGVVSSPIVKPNGEILLRPGYDPQTGIWFRPIGKLPKVADMPSHEDAMRACEALLEVVVDFPFETHTHRSTWLSGVLTPLCRTAFDGPAPLHLFDANTRGSGKSLLTDTIAHIVSGRPMSRMTGTGDGDENRKRITSLVVEGANLVLIDNVVGPLGDQHIDAALTGTVWKDRILGRSEMVAMPLNATWFASGNNVQLVADTARRVVHARLLSEHENPEAREDFTHPELIRWVTENRARLLGAALTMIRAFFVAGCPVQQIKPWGSFSGWSHLVRACIVWCGQPDPGETRLQLQESSDTEANALAELLRGWSEIDPRGKGLTISMLLLELDTNPTRYQTLRSALCELCPPQGGKLSANKVGYRFRHLRQRVVGGMSLVEMQRNEGGRLWGVVKASEMTRHDSTEGTVPVDGCR